MLDSQSQDNWGWVQFNHNFLDRQSQTDITVELTTKLQLGTFHAAQGKL